jgi:UDP-N-acetylglucosamine 4-epimerase
VLGDNGVSCDKRPVFGPFRAGDVRHSQANVDKAQRLLGYENTISLAAGLSRAMPWYIQFVAQR